MYAEFATDPKVQMLPEHMQRRLVMLFCIRCNGDATLQEQEIAFQLRITEQEWAETKALFISKKFINEANEILNWGKRQYRSDSSTERSRKHRERSATVVQRSGNALEQIQNRTDTEQNKEPNGSMSSAAPSDTCPAKEIQKIWNEVCGSSGLPKFEITAKRRTSIKVRWHAEMKKDLRRWEDFCKLVISSPFHKGENDRCWKADIDWALRPDVITKMFEIKGAVNTHWSELPEYAEEMKNANAH